MSVGTISVAINDEPAGKVNVHSSGALASSFLDAIVDLAIPANATVTISLASNDVGVNIDRVAAGGEPGLPPGGPKSKVARGNIPQACGACHGQKFVMASSGISSAPFNSYQQSVHGKADRKSTR